MNRVFQIQIRGWDDITTLLLNIEEIATDLKQDPYDLVQGIASKLSVKIVGRYELSGLHQHTTLSHAVRDYLKESACVR
jgi:hypothetical protein